MFIGHNADAFADKRAAPQTSLGTLLLASEFIDVLWPVFLLAGIEHVRVDPGNTVFTPLDLYDFPWTHSLLMCFVWALAFGTVYGVARRDAFAAAVVGAVVLSHWLLDAIVHRPDLPLTPGGTARIGLGLWNSIPGTLALEVSMFAVGLVFYVTYTRAKDRIGAISLWAFVLFLLVSYVAAAFGPPPPSATVIAWVGLAGGLLTVAWGYWIDRHRAPITRHPSLVTP
jgi:hypothetical protein